MVIFGYEHEWGVMLPDDDDAWSVMITSDFKNNVIVWKGYDKEIAQYNAMISSLLIMRGDISCCLATCSGIEGVILEIFLIQIL